MSVDPLFLCENVERRDYPTAEHWASANKVIKSVLKTHLTIQETPISFEKPNVLFIAHRSPETETEESYWIC